MKRRPWSREELILAMNLYCQLPFGKLHARNREVIALAAALNRSASSVAMKLCNLASLDPAHQERGVRGLSGASASDRAIWDEFHADWTRLVAESESLRERMLGGGETTTSDETSVSAEFIGETEASRVVSVRLAQRFFRKAILASYGSRCCVTGISIRSLLVASHILPWSRFPALRTDPRNGLCLSKLHDAAFDGGLIAFDHEYRLVLSNALRQGMENPVLTSAFAPFEGQALRLAEKFRPNPEFLRAHYETVFQG